MLPDKFKNWGDAVKAVMDARMTNVSPYVVDPAIWRVFETMAFELVPRINGYVTKTTCVHVYDNSNL